MKSTEPVADPVQDLLWLAKKLQGILSLVPALEEFRSVEEARDSVLEITRKAREETIALREEFSALQESLRGLEKTFNEGKSSYEQKILQEKASLEEELLQVRASHKVQLEAQVSEATRRKLNVEKLIEERQGRLKAIAAEEKDLSVLLHHTKSQLAEVQNQLKAIKENL